MARALVLNDTHFGVQRGTGTTPASAQDLNKWLHSEHEKLINRPELADCHLVYNGDIFDKFSVPLLDAAMLVKTWCDWMVAHPDKTIAAGMGNHDISKDSSKTSIFEFVCTAMRRIYPNRFFQYSIFGRLGNNVLVLPHYVNQEAFEREMDYILDCSAVYENSVMLVHANWDVFKEAYSQPSDHSLNISKEYADKFAAKNIQLLFGHQHNYEMPPDQPNVLIPGNQFPTSIADLTKVAKKYYTIIENIPEGEDTREAPILTFHELYADNSIYEETDIAYIQNFDPQGTKFLRVTGNLASEDLPAAMDKVSKLRAKSSDIFIITTKFTVKGETMDEALVTDGEELKPVDVMEYVYDNLTDDQTAIVKALIAKVQS